MDEEIKDSDIFIPKLVKGEHVVELYARIAELKARAEAADAVISKGVDAMESLLKRATKAEAEAARLRAALEAYPEWISDDPDDGGVGFVSCPICEGGGRINKDGSHSAILKPTHKPDCLRLLALSPADHPPETEVE